MRVRPTNPLSIVIALLLTVALCHGVAKADAGALLSKDCEVSGNCWYEVTIKAEMGEADKTNLSAVAVCYFAYTSEGRPVRADESTITGFVFANPYRGYEYLFADMATMRDGDGVWVFQVRTPPRADRLALEIKSWKNLSPVVVKDVSLRKMSRLPESVGRGSPLKKRFAASPADNILVCSGNVEAFDTDCQCAVTDMTIAVEWWMAGAKRDFIRRTVRLNRSVDGTYGFAERFYLPPFTCGGEVSIQTGENFRKMQFDKLAVFSCFQPVAFGAAPDMKEVAGDWFMRIRHMDSIHVEGFVRSLQGGGVNPKAAMAAVKFCDDNGKPLACKGLAVSKRYGQYFYIASSCGGEHFSRDLTVPRGAECVRLEIRSFNLRGGMELSDFSAKVKVKKPWNLMCQEFKEHKLPPNGMLERPDIVHRILVEWIGSDEELDRLRNREDTPVVRSMNYALVLGNDWVLEKDRTMLKLRDFPATPVSPQMTWLEDPFSSRTWQLKFDMGIWIPFLGANLPAEDYCSHCKTYWTSFFRNNTYPNRCSTMIYNDHVASGRIEALLLTMYGTSGKGKFAYDLNSMQKQLAQDPEFFEQMLYQLYTDVQLVDYYLRHGRYGLHNHNLIMANALLSFADCFSDYGFAKWYRETAIDIVASHLRGMFEPDGFIREQSALYHHTFTKTFLKIFSKMFESFSPDFRNEMSESLRKMVLADALLCPPDGFVLPMGDTGRNELRNELREAVAEAFAGTGIRFDDYPAAFEMCPSNSVFSESGLYVFRNPQAGRMVFIDLSDVLKVHGHYDIGNWLYYADGNWWVSDLGGPWRYGTKEYRKYLRSESHNVFQPQGREQKLGVAYDVELSEDSNSYILSCRTNVYGPDVGTTLRYRVLKDLSAMAVQTICAGNGRFCGKLHLGDGVLADQGFDSGEWAQWELSKGQGKAFLAISPPRVVSDVVMSAPRGIEQKPVRRLSWAVESKNGGVESTVAIGVSSNSVSSLIREF